MIRRYWSLRLVKNNMRTSHLQQNRYIIDLKQVRIKYNSHIQNTL
jgi:hypothetical protein